MTNGVPVGDNRYDLSVVLLIDLDGTFFVEGFRVQLFKGLRCTAHTKDIGMFFDWIIAAKEAYDADKKPRRIIVTNAMGGGALYRTDTPLNLGNWLAKNLTTELAT